MHPPQFSPSAQIPVITGLPGALAYDKPVYPECRWVIASTLTLRVNLPQDNDVGELQEDQKRSRSYPQPAIRLALYGPRLAGYG